MPTGFSALDSSYAGRNWGLTGLLSWVIRLVPCVVWRVVCLVFGLVDVERLDACYPVGCSWLARGRADTWSVEIRWLV